MKSYSTSNEPSITSYGVSEQLTAEFEMLKDVECKNGRTKYSNRTVEKLAQHIVCRHYNNLCYEFVNLNWAIVFAATHENKGSKIQTELINFYWIEQCHWPQQFKDYFYEKCESSGFTQGEEITVSISNDSAQSINEELGDKPSDIPHGITLNIYEHSFSISANRSNLLSCFMEWLIGVVPNLLPLIEENLLGKGHNAIREFSSFLQKQIYDYLTKHLPPAKLQQRYRLIQNWYSEDSENLIDDESLLGFWQQHNKIEGYGKYVNVVKDSLSYLNALAMVKNGMNIQYAESDTETNFTSAEKTSMIAQSGFEWLNRYYAHNEIPISRLLNAPKALNKQQVDFFELFTKYPQTLLPLTKTWLRLQAFGKIQHKIIQMKRLKKPSATSSEYYLQLCETDYRNISHNCAKLMANNQQCLLAISQIILQSAPTQSCLILLKLLPQMPSFEQYSTAFSSLLNEAINSDKVIDKQLLLEWQLSQPWINRLFKQAHLALNQINRQGFTASTLSINEDYLHCAELLFDFNKLIKQVLTQINNKKLGSEANFDADRFIFVNEFSKLYGQMNEPDIN